MWIFCFSVDFPHNHAFSRSQHHVTGELEREAGRESEREGAVYIVSRPQIYSHPAAPRRQQLPLFKGQFFSFVVTCQFRLYAQSWFWRTGELTSPQRTPIRTQKRRKEKCPVHTLLLLVFPFLIAEAEQVVRVMSRKKTAKGKGSSKSPKASPSSGRTGKGLTAAAAPSSGLVYPSRPSISNSGEFYDIAFKVSTSLA